MNNTLDFTNVETEEALSYFEKMVEEALLTDDLLEYTILTSDPYTQGAILEIIDQNNFEHSIYLNGKIVVTIGKNEDNQELD